MRLSLRTKSQPEVNLTSLIDVVLLLLIFFMVSTSFVRESQIQIRLPQTESTERIEEPADNIDIMITETGTIFINNRELINSRPETIRNAIQRVSGGDNSTLTRNMFNALRDQIDPTIASISTIMVILSSLLLALAQLFGKSKDQD